MEGLVRVSAVSADNDSRSLRFLYDQVEAHVRALQALGINSESLLMPLLMEKLPPNVRFIISRAVDQPEWDVDVLQARERCKPIGTNPTDPPTSKKPFSVPSRKSKEFSSASALINQSEGSVTCTFCKQGDPSASCGVDTDIEASFNRLRNLLKLEDHFFICLHCNNLAKNCSQVKACRICSGRHHISICEKANSSRVISENADQGGKVMTMSEANRWENKSSTTVYVDSVK